MFRPIFRLTASHLVKSGIEGVEVSGIQVILGNPQSFTETLEMNDLPLSQVPDGIAHIRILHHPEYVVIGGAGFLLWGDLVKTTYKNTRKNR